MLEIRIQQPGRDDRTFVVDGHEALIGRGKECDVVLTDRHVSGRHAKVLAGLVVIDLDSTNGTFVRGQRIRDAVVLRDGTFRLGADEEDVRIEVRETSDSKAGSTLVAGEDETATAHEEPAPAKPRSDPNEATLNQNRELRERVKKLEAKLKRYAEAVVAPYKQKIQDLESRRAVLERAVKTLRAQLEESSQDGSDPDTEVLTALQAEIERLRAEARALEERASRVEPLEREVERLRSELEAARESSGSLELASENRRLKGALEAQGERLGDVSSPDADETGRILELERLLTERTAQVRMLEARLEADGRA